MDEAAPGDPTAIPDYHWHTEPGWEVDHFYVNPRAGYKLAIDNLLDLSHATFLHRGNVGSQALVDNVPETLVLDDSVEVRRHLRDVENSATFAALMGLPRVDNLRGTVFGRWATSASTHLPAARQHGPHEAAHLPGATPSHRRPRRRTISS